MAESMMNFTEFESIEKIVMPRFNKYFPNENPKDYIVSIQRVITEPRKFDNYGLSVVEDFASDNFFGDYLSYFDRQSKNRYGIWKMKFNNWEETIGYRPSDWKDKGESPEFLFVSIPFDDTNRGSSYIVCKKGEFAKILLKANKNASKNKKEKDSVYPVLPGNMLETIMDSVFSFLRKRHELKKYGASASRGIIFRGRPGNGKTTTVAYIESLARKEKFSVSRYSTSDLKGIMNQGGAAMEKAFTGSDIIIFDDVDVDLFSSKRTGATNELLTAMDGVNKEHSSVRIFTTNEAVDDMDEAFKRPGRIDKIFHFPNPNVGLQRDYINSWHEDILKYAGITTDELINMLDEDMSFAKLNGIKNEIAIHLVNDKPVDIQDAINISCQKDADFQKSEKKKLGFGN